MCVCSCSSERRENFGQTSSAVEGLLTLGIDTTNGKWVIGRVEESTHFSSKFRHLQCYIFVVMCRGRAPCFAMDSIKMRYYSRYNAREISGSPEYCVQS